MTRTTTIRVMIVDDHDMLRTGLAVFIRSRPELRLVGEAASGAQAVALCAKVKPHVIVMDLIMPDMDGVTAITEIRKKYPHIQIIALSSFVDEALVEAALNAGAIGYLLKSVSADDLAAAIRDAHRGKSTLAPEAAQVLVTATQRPPAPAYHLTEREREVLQLLARGKSNTEIAAELNVGISTIKKHVSSILGKLSTTSRTEAVAIAVRQHLVGG